MKILYSFIVLLCSHYYLISQPFVDVIKLGYNIQPNYSVVDRNEKVSQTNSFLNLNIPLVQKSGDVFIINVEGIQAKYADDFDVITPENDFHSVALRLGFRKQWNDTWNTLFMLQNKLTGEFDDLEGDSYQIGGIGLVERKYNDDFSLRYGAYVNNEFFGIFIVPIIGIDWKINEKWYAFGNFPITGTLMGNFSPRFHAGIEYVGVVTSFRLGDEYNREYIHYVSTDPSLRADIYLTPRFVLQVNLGRSIGRFQRLYTEDDKIDLGISAFRFGDDRDQLNEEIGDGWIVQIQAVLRFDK